MDPRRCVACWECVDNCPKDVIGKVGFLWHKHAVFQNADSCIGCNKCIKTCPHGVFFKPDETAAAHRAKVKKSSVGQRLLPLTFVVSAVTGIGLHIAGHGTSHEVWHNWAVIHVVASVLWLVSARSHIGRHGRLDIWGDGLRCKSSKWTFGVITGPSSNCNCHLNSVF